MIRFYLQLSALALLVAPTVFAQGNRAVFSIGQECPVDGGQIDEQARFKYVCRDTLSDEYVIRYSQGLGTDQTAGPLVEIRFELQNLARPEITVQIEKLPAASGFRYSYAMTNQGNAKRPITNWSLVAAGDDDSLQIQHPAWRAYGSSSGPPRPAVAPQAALLEGPELRRSATMGKFVTWVTSLNERPIRAGQALGSFTVISDFRPGFTTAYVGGGAGLRLPHGIPGEVLIELEYFQRPENFHTVLLTLGPKFGPDVSAQWPAADWHLGLQRLMAAGRLSADSAYVQSLLFALEQLAQADQPFAMKLIAPLSDFEKFIDAAVRLTFDVSAP